MKTIGYVGFFVLFLLLPASNLVASTFSYPEKFRPAVTLPDACLVAKVLLKSKVNADEYFAIDAMLSGTKEQDGRGIWYLRYSDQEGNKIDFYISFPEGKVRMVLHPDQSKEEGIQSEKSALEILAEQDSAPNPLPRP